VTSITLLIGGACAETPPPAPPAPFTSETRLAPLLPAGARPVGITVSPEGKLYVLDQRSGLYEIAGRQSVRQVFATSDLDSRYGLSPALELTDVVAMAGGRFALTAPNDGFLLDPQAGTFASYFCYFPSNYEEPPGSGIITVGPGLSVSQELGRAGVATAQRTEMVGLDATGQFLFAQPRTTRLDTGEVVGSELFTFTLAGGQPIQVRRFADSRFVATGMVSFYVPPALEVARIVMASRHQLHEASPTADPRAIIGFDESIEITGLARDREGDLLVLDGAGLRILELPAALY
jgi:hypothetical protein